MVSKKQEIIELIAKNLRDFSNIKPASHREVLYAVLDYISKNKSEKELIFQADFLSVDEYFTFELELGLESLPTATYEFTAFDVKYLGDLNGNMVYPRWLVTDSHILLELSMSYDLENFRLYR